MRYISETMRRLLIFGRWVEEVHAGEHAHGLWWSYFVRSPLSTSERYMLSNMLTEKQGLKRGQPLAASERYMLSNMLTERARPPGRSFNLSLPM